MDRFSRELGVAMRRPSLLRVPGPVLRLLLGEMAEMILTGQPAVPARLTALGFRFTHPSLADAIRHAL